MSSGKFDALADSIFLGVSAFVRRELAKMAGPLEKRIDAVQTIKGDRGDRGESGPQGDPGQQGEPGVGIVGPQGERGADGIGERGADGRDGVDGVQGPQGAASTEAGPQGEKGADGVVGRDGKDGAPGERGADGRPGERGAAGLSAFEMAKASGFVGSEAEWHISLRGQDGGRGIDGQNGQNGRDGRDGERGRDALELEILEGIDEARSYARGTAATFNGGTWWAQRATDAVNDSDYRAAGWVCILRGVAEVTEEVEDGGRTVVKTTRYSDGQTQEARRKTAAMVYRGTHQSGREYDAGDAVTYGGSLFVAQRDTASPPGDGDSWKLAAKRGKDGRDS